MVQNDFRRYGTNFTLYTTLTADFFGITTAGPNYGLVALGYGLSSFVGMLFLTRIDNNSKVFLACAGVSLAGALSVALLWGRRWRRGLLARQYR